MKTYYLCERPDKIQTILHHGFQDTTQKMESSLDGVFVTDTVGTPDFLYADDESFYADDELLEISLPEKLDVSRWQLINSEKLTIGTSG